MNNAKIDLKELVWKEIDKQRELDKNYIKWQIFAEEIPLRTLPLAKIYYNNAEQIAKEKAEILNKEPQYTKDDIIEMFVEAGFHHYSGESYRYEFDTTNISLILTIKEDYLCFHIEGDICESYNSCESININFNDRKRIEFYYKKFREILEFEVGNE